MRDGKIKTICLIFLIIGEIIIYRLAIRYADDNSYGESEIGRFFLYFLGASIILMILLMIVVLLGDILECLKANDNSYKINPIISEKNGVLGEKLGQAAKTISPSAWVCPNCSKKNIPDAKFCTSCGNPK